MTPLDICVARGAPKGSGKNLHNRFGCAKGTNKPIYVKVLCLVIVNTTKYMLHKRQI